MFRAHGKGVNNELIQLIKTSMSLFRIQKFNKNLCEKERLDSKIQIFCLQFTWITILRGLQYQILKIIFFSGHISTVTQQFIHAPNYNQDDFHTSF
mgnify:CR=1 FL=1